MSNPMQRCGALCRTTGQPCRNWGMPNGRCRMHGGKSTGRPIIHGRSIRKLRHARSEARRLLEKLRELVETKV